MSLFFSKNDSENNFILFLLTALRIYPFKKKNSNEEYFSGNIDLIFFWIFLNNKKNGKNNLKIFHDFFSLNSNFFIQSPSSEFEIEFRLI